MPAKLECGLEREQTAHQATLDLLLGCEEGLLPPKTDLKGVEYGMPDPTPHLEQINLGSTLRAEITRVAPRLTTRKAHCSFIYLEVVNTQIVLQEINKNEKNFLIGENLVK